MHAQKENVIRIVYTVLMSSSLILIFLATLYESGEAKSAPIGMQAGAVPLHAPVL